VLARATTCWFLVTFAAASARAEVTELSPTVVETEPPAETELTTGIASIVAADGPVPGGAPTLAEVLSTLPSVNVRQTGGPGSFAALSIRGIGPENVAIVLDDLPLSSATLGPVDLSLYPPESLARVEVWRGAGPVRFASPLGGIVRLVTHAPRDHTDLSAHLRYGSFGTRSGHLFAAGPAGDLRYVVYLGYQGSQGDFRFYDDRDTPYNADDDVIARRQNNAYDAVVTRLKAETDLPTGGSLRLLVSSTWREQGIAGPGVAQTHDTHATQNEGLTRLSASDLSFADGRLRLDAGFDFLAGLRQYRDPAQELGWRILGAQSHLSQIGFDARAQLLESPRHETELAPRLQWSHFRQLSTIPSVALDELGLDRRRLLFGAGLEHRFDASDSLRLVPSLRVDASRDTGPDISRKVAQEWSPRLGLLWTVSTCELRANVGRFHRFPSLLERYGDLVTSQANPDLGPERGRMGDLGARCHFVPPGLERLRVEANGFGHDTRDLIVVTQNSQRWLRAENLGHVRTGGAESSLDLVHAWAALTVSYTLTLARAVDEATWHDGKQVPGIPRHRFDALLRLGPEWMALGYELSFASLTYLDRANLRPVPQRLLHNLSLTWEQAATGLSASLWLRNLFNQRSEQVPLPGGRTGTTTLVDFLGYPMPGRSIFAGVSWRTP
jgi:outer membrane cobalamin receptor